MINYNITKINSTSTSKIYVVSHGMSAKIHHSFIYIDLCLQKTDFVQRLVPMPNYKVTGDINRNYRLTVALALDVKNVDFYYYKTKS